MRTQSFGRTQEVLFLDPDDDLGSIRAKIESVAADEIYLVIPRRASILRAPLEFRILARLANDIASETIIVTSDAGRRALARQEGLRTRKSVATVRGLTPRGSGIGGLIPAVPEWIPIPNFSTVLVLGVLIGVIGVIGLVVLPVMRVTVTPPTTSVQRELDVIVDPVFRTADPGKGQLPGTLMQRRLEVTGATATSQTRQGGRDRAKGEIFFTNRSANQATVPRGAIVVARTGAKFSTDADVRIAPFTVGSSRIGITAVNPGTAGNVEAAVINQLEGGFTDVFVTNVRATSGGTDREVRAVSQDDINRVREQLLKRAQDQLMQEFAAQAGPERSVPPHTLKTRLENEIYDPPLDAEGEQVTARLTVAATVTSFGNFDLNRLAQQMLQAAAPAGFELPMDQMRLSPPVVTEATDQRMQLRVSGGGVLVKALDTSTLAQQLRGRTPSEVAIYLQTAPDLAGATSQVELSPAWAPRAFRVDVALAAPK